MTALDVRAGAARPPRDQFDSDLFRDVLGRFCSGVVVITASSRGENVGMTCQSFMSMSLDPPLVAFAPAATSSTYPVIRDSGSFAVNVLSSTQSAIALGFARRGIDRFADAPWHLGVTGAPLLDDAVAHIECELYAEHVVGDHYLSVGQVVALDGHPDAEPLLFFRSAFGAWSATSQNATSQRATSHRATSQRATSQSATSNEESS